MRFLEYCYEKLNVSQDKYVFYFQFAFTPQFYI